MMRRVGQQLEAETGAIRMAKENPQVLDTCAAPGGFVTIALDQNPSATVCALSLPKDLGGHPFLVAHSPQVRVRFMDITQLGFEYGLTKDEMQSDMSFERPYQGTEFDLVFCDGQVLRTNAEHREESLEMYAASRLTSSQLILAMNRIKQGGTLIMLLHKVEAWDTIKLLATISDFSDIQLFKPSKIHAARSSFYLIAKNVQPTSPAALAAVEKWKKTWRQATFGQPAMATPAEEDIREATDVLYRFGEQFVRIANPIWDAQRAGIERAPWFQSALRDRV
jgi:23S rRNA U2552 (ribose-2'-O)-methylase RlmE/FtsJ